MAARYGKFRLQIGQSSIPMIPNSFQDTTSITGVVCQKKWR